MYNVYVVEHACARCQDQTGALHMFYDTNESESCLVKAPAKHASESVLVVGELLCTGVQANTERHTRNETREMCSCWGYKQHSSSRKSGEWRDSNFQQSSRLANLGCWKRHLKFSLVKRLCRASDSSGSSRSRCTAECAISIFAPKKGRFQIDM